MTFQHVRQSDSGSLRSSDTSTERSPLDGIRVLDFTHVLAGPFCTRLLADFGADVVRVESTTRPDHMRADTVRPGFEGKQDRSGTYLNTNRSKRSVTINLKTPGGHDLATRLAGVADIIVENFSADAMAKLRLDYDNLAPLNPRLIYVSMAGYGHSGPRRDWRSMNMILQGYSGLMMVTGAEGDAPTSISNSWNDYIGGLHACFGILNALLERRNTGTGKFLDVSQFECSVATLGSLLLSSVVNGTAPARMGNRSSHLAPQGLYRCAGKDQWCAISIQNDGQWQSLISVMVATPWGNDERYATLLGRLRFHDEIDAHIEAWTSQLQSDAVENRLRDAGVPARRMRRVDDLVDGPEPASVFEDMPDKRLGAMLVTAHPFFLPSTPLRPPTPAPSMGEHNYQALSDWLGCSEAEVRSLIEAKVLV